MAPSSLTTEAGAQVALRPPSRLRMQLLAYLFLARKTAASATSSGVPKRETGIFIFWGLSASGLPSGVEYVRLAGGGVSGANGYGLLVIWAGVGAGGRELDRNLLPWSIPKQRVSRFACSCVAEGRFWQGGIWEGNGVAGLLLLTICHCRVNVARENRVDSCPSELGREGGCQACLCELVILLPTVL